MHSVWPPVDVVEISSPDDDLSFNGDFDLMDLDVDDVEVNSKAALTTRCVKRKLFFDNDAHLPDGRMTSGAGACIGVAGPSRQSANMIGTSKECNLGNNVGCFTANTMSPFASSCASNSPYEVVTCTP